ncbi:hypothetical protein Tco_0068371 [Tanacetum coccineum]
MTTQAKEIANLKNRVKQLEKRRKSRTSRLRRLRKIGSSSRVESFIDASLVDETQGMNNDNLMFDTGILDETEEAVVNATTILVSAVDPVTTVGEVVTTANTITVEETLAQTLIKAAKPKAITTAATTITTVAAGTRPKVKGIVFHEQEEQAAASKPVVSSAQPSKSKDKGKAIMVEPKRPLKKKDQVALDEEMARNLEAQLQAGLIKEERLARKKEEEANIALIESWDNTQAMMEEDFELAQRLQAEEQGEITIEERTRLFIELMNKRKKHFAKLRAEEIRRKPPTDIC